MREERSHQLLDPVEVRRVDDIRGNRDVVLNKLGAQCIICDDAADLGGSQEHDLWGCLDEPPNT